MAKNSKLIVEHECPQCGAPIQLGECDTLFKCNYCHVKSYIWSRRPRHLYIRDKAPKESTVFYLPFWHLQGLTFYFHRQRIGHRIFNFSRKAIRDSIYPISLGIRAQTQRLHFVDAKPKETFYSVDEEPLEFTTPMINDINSNLDFSVRYQSFIGASISLIYAPYYRDANGDVFDGITNKKSPKITLPKSNKPLISPIRFLPTLCPNCGWDLNGSSESVVLSCSNCDRYWQSKGKSFTEQQVYAFDEGTKSRDYLPFWQLEVKLNGINVKSYADLARLANVPMVIKKAWESTPFYFWAPAFKIQPQTFLRISSHLTLKTDPNFQFSPAPAAPVTVPITISAKNAADTVTLTTAHIFRPKSMVDAMLRSLHVESISERLVLIPFVHRSHELYQPTLKLAINRNAISIGAQL